MRNELVGELAELAASRMVKDPKTGQVVEQIQSNTLIYLGPDEDIKFPQPGRPNVAAPTFLSMILRLIDMSRGLSYETVTRDLFNSSKARGEPKPVLFSGPDVHPRTADRREDRREFPQRGTLFFVGEGNQAV